MRRRYGIALAAALVLMMSAAPAAFAGWDDCDGFERDGDWGRKGRYCETRETTLPAMDSLAVDAVPNGGIRVVAWDRDEILIEARVQVWDEDEDDAVRKAEGIEILTSGGTVRAESRYGDNWSVSYRIKAPREIDLQLESRNGGISVAGVAGELRIETRNGGLTLDSVAGDVVARTHNGGVNVELAGGSWVGSGLDVETRNGGVELEIPEGYSAELETGTVNGRIRIDFPVTVSGEIGRSLSTTLGSGGAPIRVKTTNGGVRISTG